MPELLLDLTINAPPDVVIGRLVTAAASAPPVAGERFQVQVRGSELRVSPPPGDWERPRAVCTGSIISESTGTRIRLHRARLAPGARAVLVAMLALAALITAVVAFQALREGTLGPLGAVGGFLLFFSLVLAVVTNAVTGAATDAARTFVRRAVGPEISDRSRSAG